MRTRERLTGLRTWAETNLCKGRELKAPGPKMKIDEIITKEPKCFLAWAPSRIDSTGQVHDDLTNVCPSIIIMPNQAYAKYMEEKRFDRYSNVHRPPDLGQHLDVSMLFTVWDPGTRLPGFIDSVGENGKGLDMTLITEGTEQGLFTLTDWMDDCMECLIRDKSIDGTDLFVEEETITYSLYTDQSYVVDKRPLYYGFVNVTFGAYANRGVNPDRNNLLL